MPFSSAASNTKWENQCLPFLSPTLLALHCHAMCQAHSDSRSPLCAVFSSLCMGPHNGYINAHTTAHTTRRPAMLQPGNILLSLAHPLLPTLLVCVVLLLSLVQRAVWALCAVPITLVLFWCWLYASPAWFAFVGCIHAHIPRATSLPTDLAPVLPVLADAGWCCEVTAVIRLVSPGSAVLGATKCRMGDNCVHRPGHTVVTGTIVVHPF